MAATSQSPELFTDYEGFVEKFKPKRTTDDCYTPPAVYEAVRDWACREYGIDPEAIVRPFWPGGDYEAHPYPEGCVVLDNPPFSCISRIVRFYADRSIPFFLFAPYLTNLNIKGCNHVIAGAAVTYENGAEVDTSFVTSFGDCLLRSAPDLHRIVTDAVSRLRKEKKAQLPKYAYPDAVVTAAMLGKYAKRGIELRIRAEECCPIQRLDAQRPIGKSIYGSGYLLSRRAAAEKAAAEKAAAEKAAAERFALSPREVELQRALDGS